MGSKQSNPRGIGNRIRLVRKLLKFTQGEFAEKLNLERYGAVFRYEKNLRKPDLAIIRTICFLGNTTSKWMLTGKVDKKLCDEIIISINESKRSLAAVAHDINVPVEYLKYLQEYKIDPSANFIKRYLAFYPDADINADVLSNLDKENYNDVHYSDANIGNQSEKINNLAEINGLLLEDVDAQRIVLSLLWGRKIYKTRAAKSEKKKNQ